MDGTEKAIAIIVSVLVLAAAATISFSVFFSHQNFVAATEAGMHQVQKGGTTNTMWVK